MKKIMIAAIAVCIAAVSQAAAVSWTTAKAYDKAGNAVKNTMTEYVYLINSSTYDQYGADTSKIWAAYGEGITKGTPGTTNTAVANKTTSKVTVNTDAVANTTYYAAIVYTIGTGADMMYYAQVGTVTTGDDGNASLPVGQALTSVESAASAWAPAQAAPEPTSGLLILLGMAGLALKRKRA